MKRLKNVRDAFKKGGESTVNELQTSIITEITNYPDNINDIYVYYNINDESKRISFTDGSVIYYATTTTTIIPESSLNLTFDNISNSDLMISGSSSDVSIWNTFFDLPTNGGEFTSVSIIGNDVKLYGGVNINIKDSLFQNNTSLLSIIDSANCITSAVGENCFYDTSIIIVNLPALVTAGVSCFEYSLFITCNLPSLTTAALSCFGNCTSINTFDLPSLTTAGNSCFYNCQSVTSFDLPSLSTADESCFSDCTLVTAFNLPLLENAGYSCFYNCTSVTTFDLPLLTIASDYCFYGCTVETFYLPSLTTADSYCFDSCPSVTEFNLPLLTTAGDSCFVNCTSGTTFNLPSCTNLGTSVLDNSVFNGIVGNTINLSIPLSLMTIDNGNPDGDIVYLQANNSVNIITI